MTNRDIIIIYGTNLLSQEEVTNYVKSMISYNDKKTKVIVVPFEYTEKVERL
jgi:hypothetical protein